MICPPEFWDGVLRRLGTELPAFTLEAWVWPLVAETSGEGIRLLCPTPFHRERIRERLRVLLVAQTWFPGSDRDPKADAENERCR